MQPHTAPAVGAFREQFENEQYCVQIYKKLEGRERKEIDPADRKCRKAPPDRHLYALDDGDTMYVYCRGHSTAVCMSYLTENTAPILSEPAELPKYVYGKVTEQLAVFRYRPLGAYKFNAVCIESPGTDPGAPPDRIYVGVLLKSHDDPVFQNKLHLGYIHNLQNARDITRTGGISLKTANIAIRRVDSGGERHNHDKYPEMLFFRPIPPENDEVDEYELHAYVRENDGITVEISNTEQYVDIQHRTVPDHGFEYDTEVGFTYHDLNRDSGGDRVLIGHLFPEKTHTKVSILLLDEEPTTIEFVTVKVSKVSDELYQLILDKKQHADAHDDYVFDMDKCSLKELADIRVQIKNRQAEELTEYFNTSDDMQRNVCEFITER